MADDERRCDFRPIDLDLLRTARQLAGLTQREVAARIGVDVARFNRIENGRVASRPAERGALRQVLPELMAFERRFRGHD